MKKSGVIFTFVALYAITAFAWWTIAHIQTNDLLYKESKENLELLCYKATVETNGAIEQELFKDTLSAKEFVNFNFPKLEIVFIDPQNQVNPLNQFMIRPKLESYASLSDQHYRKIRMYGLEGFVMVLLLIWGIVWIYRSLLTRIDFNRRQNNFMLSVTHELKTPLASVKLYLETIQKRNLDKQQSEQMIRNSLGELNRLRDLVDNILMASQLESRRFKLHSYEINLSEIVNQTIDKYALPRNMMERIKRIIEPGIFVIADQFAVEAVVTNLLSNAVKYTSGEGVITVLLNENDKAVHLSVVDEGPGIQEKDKKNLFEKFYRSGDESTRRNKGTGLGLFIVKNLLNLMKAEINIKDNSPKGTIFEITFNHSHA